MVEPIEIVSIGNDALGASVTEMYNAQMSRRKQKFLQFVSDLKFVESRIGTT